MLSVKLQNCKNANGKCIVWKVFYLDFPEVSPATEKMFCHPVGPRSCANRQTYSDVYVDNGVCVAEGDLDEVFEQRHLDRTISAVQQHNQITTD